MTGPLVIGGGTVTASTPVLDLSQTWNLAGTTFTGLKFNVTDSASASGSTLFDFQVGGENRFKLDKSGNFTLSNIGYSANGFAITSDSGAMYFGSASDTILRRDGAANTVALRNLANAQTWNVYGTADSGLLNYRRIRTTMSTGGAATIAAEGLGTGVSGNTLAFSQNGAAVLSLGDATSSFNGALQINGASSLIWSSRARIYSPLDAQFLFANNTLTDADFFLKLGVNTSAAAGIKRVGTALQVRLNDDSAFATIQGKLRTDNAYVAGAVVGTGYVTITDSTGTAYRVPVLV